MKWTACHSPPAHSGHRQLFLFLLSSSFAATVRMNSLPPQPRVYLSYPLTAKSTANIHEMTMTALDSLKVLSCVSLFLSLPCSLFTACSHQSTCNTWPLHRKFLSSFLSSNRNNRPHCTWLFLLSSPCSSWIVSHSVLFNPSNEWPRTPNDAHTNNFSSPPSSLSLSTAQLLPPTRFIWHEDTVSLFSLPRFFVTLNVIYIVHSQCFGVKWSE